MKNSRFKLQMGGTSRRGSRCAQSLNICGRAQWEKLRVTGSICVKLILLTFAFCILTSIDVYGQESISIRLTPIRHELTLQPGEQSEISLSVYNPMDAPISGTFHTYDFVVHEKNGAPTIYENPTPLSSRYSARSWIMNSVQDTIIPAQESITIPITITVPPDAIPGEKYAAVFFEKDSSSLVSNTVENDTNVFVSSRIGSLITIRIPGSIQEKAVATPFTIQRIIEQGPITIQFEIRNNGSYRIRPQGTFTITDMLGKTVEEQRLTEYNIFPDASRLYKFTIGNQWMLGKYNLKLSAVYGERGQTIIQGADVWIIPWKVAITLVLFLLILYFLMKHLQKAPGKIEGSDENSDRLLRQTRRRE